jgi:tetratricopeptide (TPR) repeat protein
VAVAAYSNSFQGAFVFDDTYAVVENLTIRSLWPLGPVLDSTHIGSPTDGRPVVNLSLAVNYALGGLNPWGYHAVNLAVHILAALMLFGVVRRTLLLPSLRDRFAGRSTTLALAAALIWAVHPLQSESVTYVSQRAESLAALLYLAVLYGCIRAFAGERGVTWQVLAVAACLVGMATKETLVSAPLIVLLYDRTFVSLSFREAIKRHWKLYLSLAATWGLLAALVIRAEGRGGTVGIGHGISSWDYARTQFGAIAHYLRLCFWPHPLCLDYGTGLATRAWDIVPYAILVGLLLAGTVVALRLLPWAGFLGVFFFATLAPSSSVIPVVTQTMAEHRMYLPLAAVVVLTVLLAQWAWRRCLPPLPSAGPGRRIIQWAVPMAMVCALVGGGICLTVLRNEDYRSQFSIWEDNVRKAPDNARAWCTFGTELAAVGRTAEAIAHYEQALRLRPDYPDAHNHLGMALAGQGRIIEAIPHYERATILEPKYTDAYNNLGVALASQGRVAEAATQYEQALKLKPDSAVSHSNMGNLLAEQGRSAEAIAHYEKALRQTPDSPPIHYNLALTLASQGRLAEAAAHYEAALKIRPDYPEARAGLGHAMLSRGRFDEAIAQYAQALRLKPDFVEVRNNLGVALASQGRLDEAVAQLEQALAIRPDYADSHYNMGKVLAGLGRIDEAIAHLERAAQLRPDMPGPRQELNHLLELRRRGPSATKATPAAAAQP